MVIGIRTFSEKKIHLRKSFLREDFGSDDVCLDHQTEGLIDPITPAFLNQSTFY